MFLYVKIVSINIGFENSLIAYIRIEPKEHAKTIANV